MVHPAFLFDLDGTILDTLADLGGACNTVLANHGWPEHPLADYRQFVGNGFKRLVERALPQRITLGLSVAEKTACISEAWEHYASHLLCQTRPYPGIPEVLKGLASQGYSLAVLSNKPDPMTQTLVGHFFPGLFAVVHGGRENIPLKPDPTAVLDTIAELGSSTKSTFYIGDSNVDIFTAKNAGLPGIGVAWGFRGSAELIAAGAERILTKPSEILSLLSCNTPNSHATPD